ncbi:MAG: TatD family hydrolase [Gammaproteobacteria bacterium]
MFTDSHCHLSFPELRHDMPGLLQAMASARVDRALTICTTLEEFEDVHALATGHAQLWATVGVHPDNEGVREPSVDVLLALASQPRVVGIGETGLDYYRLNGRSIADMAWQRERFRVHIEAARRAGLPAVIHPRNAADDTLSMLRCHGGLAAGEDSLPGLQPLRGVLHCFTETEAVARTALNMGLYISFSGIITFKNAADLREVVRLVPMDRILIETDSPYLAPVPYRGKTNSPALVPYVAACIAEVKGVPVEAVAEATSRNFEQLFTAVQP